MDFPAALLEQISSAVDAGLAAMTEDEKSEMDSIILVCVRKGGQSGVVKIFHDPDTLPNGDAGKNLMAIHSIRHAVGIARQSARAIERLIPAPPPGLAGRVH